MLAVTIDSGGLYEWLAKLGSTVALWASMRAERAQPTPEEAMADLTLRLRHPWKYRIARVTRLLH